MSHEPYSRRWASSGPTPAQLRQQKKEEALLAELREPASERNCAELGRSVASFQLAAAPSDTLYRAVLGAKTSARAAHHHCWDAVQPYLTGHRDERHWPTPTVASSFSGSTASKTSATSRQLPCGSGRRTVLRRQTVQAQQRRRVVGRRSREELLRARRALVERAPPGGVELPAECGSGLLSSEAPFSRLMLRHANLGTTAHKYEARRIDARAGFFDDDDATLPLELPSSPAAAAVESPAPAVRSPRKIPHHVPTPTALCTAHWTEGPATIAARLNRATAAAEAPAPAEAEASRAAGSALRPEAVAHRGSLGDLGEALGAQYRAAFDGTEGEARAAALAAEVAHNQHKFEGTDGKRWSEHSVAARVGVILDGPAGAVAASLLPPAPAGAFSRRQKLLDALNDDDAPTAHGGVTDGGGDGGGDNGAACCAPADRGGGGGGAASALVDGSSVLDWRCRHLDALEPWGDASAATAGDALRDLQRAASGHVESRRQRFNALLSCAEAASLPADAAAAAEDEAHRSAVRRSVAAHDPARDATVDDARAAAAAAAEAARAAAEALSAARPTAASAARAHDAVAEAVRRSRAASTLAAAAERRDVPIEGMTDARRRRWYVVAAALATTPYQRRRGGPAYRHVDIETGSHEFLLGQSNEWREPLEAASDARARSLSGERPARVRAPWVERVAPPPGFVVHRTEVDALSAQISADARHATAPRALLEVLVGGAPLREKGGTVRFYVVTPVVIVAEGAEYSRAAPPVLW